MDEAIDREHKAERSQSKASGDPPETGDAVRKADGTTRREGRERPELASGTDARGFGQGSDTSPKVRLAIPQEAGRSFGLLDRADAQEGIGRGAGSSGNRFAPDGGSPEASKVAEANPAGDRRVASDAAPEKSQAFTDLDRQRPAGFGVETGRFGVPTEVEARWRCEPQWGEQDTHRLRQAAEAKDWATLTDMARRADFSETGGRHGFYNKGSENRPEAEYRAHICDHFTLEQTAAGAMFDKVLREAGLWSNAYRETTMEAVGKPLSESFALQTRGSAFVFERNGTRESAFYKELQILEQLKSKGQVTNLVTDTPLTPAEYEAELEWRKSRGLA